MDFLKNLGEGIYFAFKGVPMTMAVSLIAVIVGLLIGFLLAFMRRSKLTILRGLSTLYTDIVRGTPLVVQVFILAYGVPILLTESGVPFKWPHVIIPAIICCGLNSAAYMGEIVRSGLQAVDRGQIEAAQSLGMTHRQAQRLIVIPQAIRIILPPLGNEFVTMIKETAVLSFVGLTEIMREGTLLSARTFETFTAYGGVAIVYMIFTIPLSKLILRLEQKMKID